MKSSITLEIEKALIKKFKDSRVRYATEVNIQRIVNLDIKNGICDFVTAEMDYSKLMHHITCYEIKVSLGDMKSQHGHSLFGDESYYVFTDELYEEIMNKNPNLIMGKFGIYVYNKSTKRLKIKREYDNHWKQCGITIEQRFDVLDQIMMRWHRGNMNKYFIDVE